MIRRRPAQGVEEVERISVGRPTPTTRPSQRGTYEPELERIICPLPMALDVLIGE